MRRAWKKIRAIRYWPLLGVALAYSGHTEEWTSLCPTDPNELEVNIAFDPTGKDSPAIQLRNRMRNAQTIDVEVSFIDALGQTQSIRYSARLRPLEETQFLHHGMRRLQKVLSAQCHVSAAVAEPAPKVLRPLLMEMKRTESGQATDHGSDPVAGPERLRSGEERDRAEQQWREQRDAQRRIEEAREQERRDQELRAADQQGQRVQHQRDDDLRHDRERHDQQLNDLRDQQMRDEQQMEDARRASP